MKLFLNESTQEVFAYEEDGSQDHLISSELRAITEEEAKLLQPKPDPKLQLLEQIQELERKVTPRRIREAIITGDTSFIISIESQIRDLRKSLT